jgi:hypothetical protein
MLAHMCSTRCESDGQLRHGVGVATATFAAADWRHSSGGHGGARQPATLPVLAADLLQNMSLGFQEQALRSNQSDNLLSDMLEVETVVGNQVLLETVSLSIHVLWLQATAIIR